MDGLLKTLDGYKAYIGAAGLLLAAWYYYQQGDTAHAMELLALAGSVVGLRHALTKTSSKPAEAKAGAEDKPAA